MPGYKTEDKGKKRGGRYPPSVTNVCTGCGKDLGPNIRPVHIVEHAKVCGKKIEIPRVYIPKQFVQEIDKVKEGEVVDEEIEIDTREPLENEVQDVIDKKEDALFINKP